MRCYMGRFAFVYNVKTELGLETNSFEHYIVQKSSKLYFTTYSERFIEAINIIKIKNNASI